MAVEVNFKVASVDKMPVKLPAKLDDGTVVTATVEGVRVQLVPNDVEAHSTVSLLMTGGDAVNARETFKVGAGIKAVFEQES